MARLSQNLNHKKSNAASQRRYPTVRIITDLSVLVQAEKTVKRKGRSKPLVIMFGGLRYKFTLTDSGQSVLKIDEPP